MKAEILYPNKPPFDFNVPCVNSAIALLTMMAGGFHPEMLKEKGVSRQPQHGDKAIIEGKGYEYREDVWKKLK
jgi:hypothetical protein